MKSPQRYCSVIEKKKTHSNKNKDKVYLNKTMALWGFSVSDTGLSCPSPYFFPWTLSQVEVDTSIFQNKPRSHSSGELLRFLPSFFSLDQFLDPGHFTAQAFFAGKTEVECESRKELLRGCRGKVVLGKSLLDFFDQAH